MGRSQDSWNKKEKEKKKLKKKKEKAEKKLERKANSRDGNSLDDMIAYVDENGNISSTPPDPMKKSVIKSEDIEVSVARRVEEEIDPIHSGIVSFFNDSKGYGFIRDLLTQESIFVHVNNVKEPIAEGHKVSFEIEMGPKGPNAINVEVAR